MYQTILMNTVFYPNTLFSSPFLSTFQSKRYFPIRNQHTKVTFEALVDAIIPYTPELASKLNPRQVPGGLIFHTDELKIWSLNHLLTNVPLADSTANMLNIAANQLIITGKTTEPINFKAFYHGDIFASLSRNNRFNALLLLEQLKINLNELPLPYKNNPGFVIFIANALNGFIMFDYYSEWSAYGTTSLASPEERKLQRLPFCWKQVEYPGPSRGSHDFRGYLIKEFTE